MANPVDLIALSLLPIGRWRAAADQLRSGQSASDVLYAHCADGVRGRSPAPAWADRVRTQAAARLALERAAAVGLRAVTREEEEYPPLLLEIVDPPPVLWLSGEAGALSRLAVAVVGSRAGSSYAVGVAEQLGADLARRGVVVVSGLARGVDSAAHQGALSVDGVTVAVLGCGADIVYPPEHAALASEIARRGAVVSEFLPGTVPRPGFFPRRNRLISGLVRAVVVIEAGEKSGSLITARCALEQGREVLAVPGNVLSGRNKGGHALLRDGARLVETAEDVLEELGWGRTTDARSGVAQGPPGDAVLDSMIPGEPSDLGQISARSGLSAAAVLSRLLELELAGALKRAPGGRFVRFDRTC
jgi:DNA processing protein